ncbi:MAG: glycosyltransferase [Candidatus Daviesbacteria bacterium]|nr:glycosyltransferase [Candidatus Daviesbacteria bacterium]
MRVALVHDFLVEYGGGERVLEALAEIFPDASIYTAYFNPDGFGPHKDRIKSWNIKTSWLQFFPRKLISPFRIFAAQIFENFDLSAYDLVISSCNTYFAKAVKVRNGALHISYIHTPPRYLYGYTTSFNYKKNPLTRVLGELANHFLRIKDFEVSQRPDILVANSKEVQARIKKFYRRDSVVIYPPVDLMSFPRTKADLGMRESNKKNIYGSRIKSGMTEGKYFLSVGRLVRGKGIDIIIEACVRLGLPLKVVGSGPERENLESRIKNQGYKNIEFLGQVSDRELPKLYAGAKATIVASEDEDFGITSIEAQAAGTPVIAPASGGFLETVIDGKTGLLYGGPGMVNADSLIGVLREFREDQFKSEDLRKNAEKFSKERFKKEILELVEKNLRA